MKKRDTDDKSLEEKETRLAGLFNEYYPKLAGYAYNHTGNRAVGEDIAGEVFLRALKALPSYRDRGLPMGAWLFRIAHNLVIDYYRRQDRRTELPLAEDSSNVIENPTARLEHEHDVSQVNAAMKHLSPAQQEVMRLRFAAGLSSKDVAALMGKSDGAVREMQREALSRLRGMLGGDKQLQ
jgi:RNA polymerase sigma-70 factor (ECF subfamily)